jgi:hypothetical protein
MRMRCTLWPLMSVRIARAIVDSAVPSSSCNVLLLTTTTPTSQSVNSVADRDLSAGMSRDRRISQKIQPSEPIS